MLVSMLASVSLFVLFTYITPFLTGVSGFSPGAVTGVLSAGPAAAIGPFAFGLYRHTMVTAVLGLLVLATGGGTGLPHEAVLRLALSGIVGIFLGDTILYLALVRLGPRRTGALFALNAPIAALLGWALLGERLPLPSCGHRARHARRTSHV